MANDSKGEFDIGPARELQQRYGWSGENRPVMRVEESEVPPSLQDLIPLVERWAIPCDITRHDYFAKQSNTEVRELARVVGRREKEINAWLDSTRSKWPEAAHQFMYLLKAWCEAACQYPDEVP
jgi:hypothetical protein